MYIVIVLIVKIIIDSFVSGDPIRATFKLQLDSLASVLRGLNCSVRHLILPSIRFPISITDSLPAQVNTAG